ncbi:hypothetical protein Bbelb_392300 [Branchiostoma belcheri]|nr:hypothetical protein Bbelb_392300 [Branchiostoma belcheri]
MAQGYKSGGPGDGNYWGSDPNRTRGSTVQGFKRAPTALYNLKWDKETRIVSWTLPPDQGITSVNIQLLIYEVSGWEKIEKDFDGSTQSVTVQGPLENRQLQVRAVNRFGTGDASVTTRRTCFCVLSTCKNVGKRRASVRGEYHLRTESYGFGSTQTRRRTLSACNTFSTCGLRIYHPCVRVRATRVPRTAYERATYGLLYKDDLTGDCQLVSKMPRKAQKKSTRQDPKKRATEDTRAASDDEVNRRCTHLQRASTACTRQRGNRTEIVRCKHVQLTYHLPNVRCTQPLTARRVVQTTYVHLASDANKSSGSDFDTIEIQMEENQSLGSTAQGYPYRSTERYNPPQRPRYYYQEPDNDWGCFLGETSVQLRDGRKIAMKDLKPGDRVRVVTPDGRLAYSPYIAMLHREPDKKTTFLQIYVEGKDGPVCLTPDHLIPATKNPQGIRSIGRPIFAKAVEEGMSIFLADEESGKVAPAKVREVKEMEATGFCAPLTKEGTIMADGVAASCYADFDHGLSHKAFAPLRLLYGLKSALGIGGKEKEVFKVGIHWYAKALMNGNKFLFHLQPASTVM